MTTDQNTPLPEKIERLDYSRVYEVRFEERPGSFRCRFFWGRALHTAMNVAVAKGGTIRTIRYPGKGYNIETGA